MQGLRELMEGGHAALEVKLEPSWDYQEKVDAATANLYGRIRALPVGTTTAQAAFTPHYPGDWWNIGT
jgi:hypothetical protein